MEEFNLSEFIRYYLNFVFVIVIAMVIGFAASWYYTNQMQVPLYKSQTSIVLTRTNTTTTITQSDISLNKNLVSTYREIIKSRRILSQVIQNLKLNMTEEELSERINITSENDTELIVISVLDEKSKTACKIANEIAEVFKKEITSIYNIENISIVDEAVEAKDPANVSVAKQYILGIGAGFFIGSLIILILFYFDDSIKNAEEIEEKMNLNVLATVPKQKLDKE